MREAFQVLWWSADIPTVAEAVVRLDHLRAHGPTPRAFTFRKPFPAPGGRAGAPRRRLVLPGLIGATSPRLPAKTVGPPAHDGAVTAPSSALQGFSPATRDWFAGAFAAPTPAQEGAWAAAQAGRHALVVAPTGSGKTLAAFLWALDRLASGPPPESPQHRCRVLYVSPLKALAVDVQRNLRSPLAGIRQAAQRLGLPVPDVTVGMRTGDTPADERRQFARTPPDVLVTTPESLFLLLTSAARESLRGVTHRDPRRGARGRGHEARRAPGPLAGAARRAVGARPPSASACRPPSGRSTRCPRSSRGGRPVEVVQPRTPKTIAGVGRGAGARSRRARRAARAGQLRRGGDRLGGGHRPAALDLARRRAQAPGAGARSTAPRSCSPTPGGSPSGSRRGSTSSPPRRRRARRSSTSSRPRRSGSPGIGGGAAATVAKAHHGSMSREQRTLVEEELKGGRAALRRGHVQPGAGHRHGRGRSRDPGRGAAERRLRAAAGGPRRPPGRRGVHRGGVPQVPGRPRRVRGGRRADDGGRDRVAALPAQPARRARPAHRRDGRAGAVVAGRARRRRAPGRAVRRAARVGPARRARHAGRALPVRGVRRAARADHLGPRHRPARAAAPVRSGWPSPRAARSPIAACSP